MIWIIVFGIIGSASAFWLWKMLPGNGPGWQTAPGAALPFDVDEVLQYMHKDAKDKVMAQTQQSDKLLAFDEWFEKEGRTMFFNSEQSQLLHVWQTAILSAALGPPEIEKCPICESTGYCPTCKDCVNCTHEEQTIPYIKLKNEFTKSLQDITDKMNADSQYAGLTGLTEPVWSNAGPVDGPVDEKAMSEIIKGLENAAGGPEVLSPEAMSQQANAKLSAQTAAEQQAFWGKGLNVLTKGPDIATGLPAPSSDLF